MMDVDGKLGKRKTSDGNLSNQDVLRSLYRLVFLAFLHQSIFIDPSHFSQHMCLCAQRLHLPMPFTSLQENSEAVSPRRDSLKGGGATSVTNSTLVIGTMMDHVTQSVTRARPDFLSLPFVRCFSQRTSNDQQKEASLLAATKLSANTYTHIMAPGGPPGGRGRGGKFKTKRGGGRHFSRNIGEVEGEDAFEKWQAKDSDDEESSEEDSDEEDSEEESSEEEDAPARPTGFTVDPKKAALFGNTPVAEEEPEMSRAERKAMKKNKKAAPKKKVESSEESESESEEEVVVKKVNKMNISSQQQQRKPAAKIPVQEMTRKEREEADKKAAAEKYQALHAAGKTDQAKADMARLQRIRKEREEAAAKRLAEAASAKEEAEAKRAAQKGRR